MSDALRGYCTLDAISAKTIEGARLSEARDAIRGAARQIDRYCGQAFLPSTGERLLRIEGREFVHDFRGARDYDRRLDLYGRGGEHVVDFGSALALAPLRAGSPTVRTGRYWDAASAFRDLAEYRWITDEGDQDRAFGIEWRRPAAEAIRLSGTWGWWELGASVAAAALHSAQALELGSADYDAFGPRPGEALLLSARVETAAGTFEERIEFAEIRSLDEANHRINIFRALGNSAQIPQPADAGPYPRGPANLALWRIGPPGDVAVAARRLSRRLAATRPRPRGIDGDAAELEEMLFDRTMRSLLAPFREPAAEPA